MKRVLAVDDEPHILRLVSFSLSSHGFEVVQASDGMSACEVAERELPDLILMDVMMPVLNGYEACERIKGNPKTAHIPVVMLSAKSQGYETLRAGPPGTAADYLLCCLGGPRYGEQFKRRLADLVGRWGIAHLKFDGCCLVCPETDHGHAPGAMSSEAIAGGLIATYAFLGPEYDR